MDVGEGDGMDLFGCVEMPPFDSLVGAHWRRLAGGMGPTAVVGRKRCLWTGGGEDGALDCERDALAAVTGYEGWERGFRG